MIARATIAFALLLAAGPAFAQDDASVRFCPNRPSLASSGCTTLPGQIQVEMSGADWQRDDRAGQREERWRFGDVLTRIGVAAHSEVQLGWTAYGITQARDRATGVTERQAGAGDISLAWRRAITHPDGEGVTSALQPYVTLPVGHSGIGEGDWSAGIVAPVQWTVDEHWILEFTGTASAAVDQDGSGRHFDAVTVAGVAYAITPVVHVTGEFSVERDNDPSGHVTRSLLAGSIAWQPSARTQIDMLAVAGASHDAPDARIVIGGAVLF